MLLPYLSLKCSPGQYVNSGEKPGYSVYLAQYPENFENPSESKYWHNQAIEKKIEYCVHMYTDKAKILKILINKLDTQAHVNALI